MAEEKSLLNELAATGYNAADRPFDFVDADTETAIVCEPDGAIRETLSNILKNLGYQVTEANSAKDALKNMRFHLFDMVVINENFDLGEGGKNEVLTYLQTLAMSTRRQIFVGLISDNFRTMDNMAAFNKSVNVIVNLKNIGDAGTILRGAIADNKAFYRVMKDILRKMGKI